jgi:phosphate-selective porin OprO and OprP
MASFRPVLIEAQAAWIAAGVVLASLWPISNLAAQSSESPVREPQDTREPRKPPEEEPPEKDVGFRWKGYPSLHLGKGSHIDFRGRVQLDVRGSESRLAADAAESDFARRRIALEGELAGVVSFEIERELDGENPWRDVYANYRQFDFIQVQGGKFKLPFSMDANTGATNLDFVYRSLAARTLAPGRDRGVMAHGRLVNRIVRYELGVFDHDGGNARTNNLERVAGERTVAARVVMQPFRASKTVAADMQVGAAFTSSDVPLGRRSLRGQTTFEETFFDPDLWVQGTRRRTGFELRWRPGPFSIKSEYLRVTTERLGQSVEDTALSPLVATGWYVSGTWAVTGEKKSNGLSSPRRPLLRGGVGAVEVALRFEMLRFGSGSTEGTPSSSVRAEVVEPSDIHVATIGANWYLNAWVKFQVNAIRERIGNPRRSTSMLESGSWSPVVRFQFTL